MPVVLVTGPATNFARYQKMVWKFEPEVNLGPLKVIADKTRENFRRAAAESGIESSPTIFQYFMRPKGGPTFYIYVFINHREPEKPVLCVSVLGNGISDRAGGNLEILMVFAADKPIKIDQSLGNYIQENMIQDFELEFDK